MIRVSVQKPRSIGIVIHRSEQVDVSMQSFQTIALNPYPDYEGAITVIPSDTEQILHTTDTLLRNDIRIAKIPSNYGKIEFDGSRIRIT